MENYFFQIIKTDGFTSKLAFKQLHSKIDGLLIE
jgi:hypothetical protein